MKIQFSDKSFIECTKQNDKVIITISARDHHDPLIKVSNTVELTIEEFNKLIDLTDK